MTGNETLDRLAREELLDVTVEGDFVYVAANALKGDPEEAQSLGAVQRADIAVQGDYRLEVVDRYYRSTDKNTRMVDVLKIRIYT